MAKTAETGQGCVRDDRATTARIGVEVGPLATAFAVGAVSRTVDGDVRKTLDLWVCRPPIYL